MRIVIGEDNVLLREGLASLLTRHGHVVVGLAENGDHAVDLVQETVPEVAIIDIRMPPTHTGEGLDAAHTIRSSNPAVGVLLLSAHAELEPAAELLASGRGVGYLLKDRISHVKDFLDAVDRVGAGGCVIDPALVQELLEAQHRVDPLETLSARERDVLAEMAQGRSNAGIARTLSIAGSTVEKHVRSILAKLDLAETDDDHRRVLAVLRFLEFRWLSRDAAMMDALHQFPGLGSFSR